MNVPTSVSPRVVVIALLGASLLSSVFATSYILSLGNPQPHRVPIAVVGTGDAVAQTVAALDAQNSAFRVVAEPTLTDALDAIDHRDVYAALVPTESQLIVAQAAGFGTAAFLTTALTAAATSTGQSLAVKIVHPLPKDDPRGSVMSFFVLALVFGGYFGATVLTTLAGSAPPTLRSGERRVIALLLYAIVTGVVTTLVAGFALGHFSGYRLAVAGLATLVVFAVASAVAALQIAIGILGSLVAMMVILWLGSQGSGGLASWEFLPLVTRSVGPYLPAGAGLDLVRNVLYFDGNSIARDSSFSSAMPSSARPRFSWSGGGTA